MYLYIILSYKSALIFWLHLNVFAYRSVSSKTVQLKSLSWDCQKLGFCAYVSPNGFLKGSSIT